MENVDKRSPNTERNTNTGRKLSVEELLAEREAAVARQRLLNVN